MICPKCNGPMRSYERNGVMVDQCGDCRGIFLDRGELEHLIDAESRYLSGPPAQPLRSYAAAPTSHHQPPASPASIPPAEPAAGRSPMADLSTIASMATGYLNKGKGSGKQGKKGKKSFIDGLFG